MRIDHSLFTLLVFSIFSHGQEFSNYTETEVPFLNSGDTIYGKLMLPKDLKGKVPTIVFIHGSGPEDYSSSDNYRYLWERFTKAGFACFSWDRPGVNNSQGKWYEQDIGDRAKVVLSAIDRLKSLDRVDGDNLGLWGISQAGWVISKVVNSYSPSFIINVSGATTSIFDQELYRVKASLKAEGYGPKDIQRALSYTSSIKKIIDEDKSYVEFEDLQKNIAPYTWKNIVLSGEKIVFDYLDNLLENDYEPTYKVQCPILAIWGQNDRVVPAKESEMSFKKLMKKNGNTNITTLIIPDADHTLTLNHSGKVSETIERRKQFKDDPEKIFAPGFVDNMVKWLDSLKSSKNHRDTQDTDPWTAYMNPSEIHKLLSNYTGPFTLEITMEGQEPIAMDSNHEMILGGRFLTMVQKGSMLGMEYESLFTIGYNTVDHTLSMTTLTNMGTGTLYLAGKASGQGGTFTLFGSLTNPVSKQEINVRQTITFPDKDTLLIESYDQEGDHPEKRTVTYRFARK